MKERDRIGDVLQHVVQVHDVGRLNASRRRLVEHDIGDVQTQALRVRRGLFGRHRDEEAEPAVAEEVAEPPSHVRVLAASEVEADPWERGFDGDEPEPGEPEPSGFGRIRRRRR